jgi:hypothetical protein
MVRTIKEETKKEGQRKAKRLTTRRNQEKGKELVPLVVGSYLTHNPSIVTYMQIVRFNSNGRSRTKIIHQFNFLLYNRGKNTLKSNTNKLPRKLNLKR